VCVCPKLANGTWSDRRLILLLEERPLVNKHLRLVVFDVEWEDAVFIAMFGVVVKGGLVAFFFGAVRAPDGWIHVSPNDE